jgi:hypothetical protein
VFGAKPFGKCQPVPSFFLPYLDFPPVLFWGVLVSHLWRDPHQTELGVDSCSLCGQVRKTKIRLSEPLGEGEAGPSRGICDFDFSGQALRGAMVVRHHPAHLCLGASEGVIQRKVQVLQSGTCSQV